MRLILAALAVTVAAPAAAAPLDAVLAGPQRSEANKARDKYRHPAETLAFFGIKPTMTVVEVSPGGGWYTEILAAYLHGSGQYIGAAADPSTERGAKSAATFKAKLDSYPGYAGARMTAFGKNALEIAPAGSADAVLTFRNIHNFTTAGFGPQAFQAFYKALKPGGTLGIVEHRLPENRPDAQQETSGYMKVSTVRKLAADAGFRLVEASEINANPKDTADYPDGVWTLPPNFRRGDVDRAKYAAIGESDRMTLKFVKPK